MQLAEWGCGARPHDHTHDLHKNLLASTEIGSIFLDINAWNRGAQQMYGWSEAEALKMDIRQLVPKGKVKELEKVTQKLKNDESIKSLETQRMCKNGKLCG